MGAELAFYLASICSLAGVLLLGIFVSLVLKRYLLAAVAYLIRRTTTQWDDAILRRGVLKRLGHLAPALVVYVATPLALDGLDSAVSFIRNATQIYMIVILALVLDAVLNAVEDIYRTTEISREIPIKGFVQVIKLVLYFVAVILIIAVLLNKTPLYLLSGLGALTAVLMLVFRDAILGFVAGIQLTANKMVAHGDWIEMPKYGADGDVMEVTLTTVKIRNFDKTITTIPTYALISESFKNWRGMQESGGRRIKRAVYIDVSSIRFCDEDMLDRFVRIQYIAEYIQSKKRELDAFNTESKADHSSLANGRRMTNIGTFRAYVLAWLRNHPMINPDMTLLVRQLPPGDNGLPIEIYVFCKDKEWANYEAIQADIFDHILAVVAEFDLRVFQHPTGGDFRRLVAPA